LPHSFCQSICSTKIITDYQTANICKYFSLQLLHFFYVKCLLWNWQIKWRFSVVVMNIQVWNTLRYKSSLSGQWAVTLLDAPSEHLYLIGVFIRSKNIGQSNARAHWALNEQFRFWMRSLDIALFYSYVHDVRVTWNPPKIFALKMK